MPQREEIRQKNLFSVSEVRLFWHPQGESLCGKARPLAAPCCPNTLYSLRCAGGGLHGACGVRASAPRSRGLFALMIQLFLLSY